MDLPAVSPPDSVAGEVTATDLGALARLGGWLAAAQGTVSPQPLQRPRVIVFAADHGIAAVGVSVHERSAELVAQVGARTAPIARAAQAADASVRVVDVGLATAERPASGRIDREDALGADEAEAAFTAGREIADEEVDAGADLLVPAAIGAGATTPATAVVAALTGTEPVAAIGRGSGIDDLAWMRKAAAVRDAMRRAKPHVKDPLALVRVAGGADLAALTGFCLQAAARRTPVLLDGVVVGAAALLADTMVAGARDWWLVPQGSAEPAMTIACERLGLDPLLDLGIRLVDGTGAVAALPLLALATALAGEGRS